MNPISQPPPFNEQQIIKEIRDLKQLNRDAPASIPGSVFCKCNRMKIAECYYQIACHYFDSNNNTEGNKFWQKSVKHCKHGTTIQTDHQTVNRENQFQYSEILYYKIQLHVKEKLLFDNASALNKALSSVYSSLNVCLSIEEKPIYFLKKYVVLQLMSEYSFNSPEEPLTVLKLYIKICPDKDSEEYTRYVNIYGSELAKRGRLDDAKEWFTAAVERKKHPISFLYLGKVEQHLGDEQEALKAFKEAHSLSKDDVEIQLWYYSQQVKMAIGDIQKAKELPSDEKLNQMIETFNRFCETLNCCNSCPDVTTSNFISLKSLMIHFTLSTVPSMADTLCHLHQYPFALHLYENLLLNIEPFIRLGAFEPLDKVKILTTIGTLYARLKESAKAAEYFEKAIKLKDDYIPAYENYIATLIDKRDVSQLDFLCWRIELRFALDREEAAGILFNLGTAYAIFGKEYLNKAIEFFEKSQVLEPGNSTTHLQYARVLVLAGDFTKADHLLSEIDREKHPFIYPDQDFQISFCHAGIKALNGDIDEAHRFAQAAANTRHSPQETENLFQYINALRNPKNDSEAVKAELVASIRKMEFTFRIGRVTEDKSLRYESGEVVGYHGTTDSYMASFTEAIKPQQRKEAQYRGQGFYTTDNFEAAAYFANKKAHDDDEGKPVVLTIIAKKDLTGKVFEHSTKKLPRGTEKQFDFVSAPISGFERYTQHYFFENVLDKLAVNPGYQEAYWDDKKYLCFGKYWRTDGCSVPTMSSAAAAAATTMAAGADGSSASTSSPLSSDSRGGVGGHND